MGGRRLMNEHDHETGLNLEQVLAILRRRAPLIVFCSLIVGAAAFVFSEQQPKQYTASASLVFNNNAISQELAGLPTTASTDPATQQQTNLSLVKLGHAGRPDGWSDRSGAHSSERPRQPAGQR